MILIPYPSFLFIKFSEARIFLIRQKGYLAKFSGTVRNQIFGFLTENRGKSSLPPPQYPKVFQHQKFSDLKRGLPYEVLRYCEKTNIRRKSLIHPSAPSSIQKNFRYRNFPATQMVSNTKSYGTLRQQILEGET